MILEVDGTTLAMILGIPIVDEETSVEVFISKEACDLTPPTMAKIVITVE